MKQYRDAVISSDQMQILKRYDTVVAYLYPILQDAPRKHGVNFLGYRIWSTHKLMRRQSVATAKRKIKRYASKGELEKLRKFMASWRGHAQWADSKNLIKNLESIYARSS